MSLDLISDSGSFAANPEKISTDAEPTTEEQFEALRAEASSNGSGEGTADGEARDTPAPDRSKLGGRLAIPTDLPIDKQADYAWDAIMGKNDRQTPKVLLHDYDIVRLAEGKVAPYNKHSLREQMSRDCDFRRFTTKKKGKPDQEVVESEAKPPMEIAEGLLSREPSELKDALRIESLTDVPVVTKNGEILSTPGYHADSRTYYEPAKGLGELHIPLPGAIRYMQQVQNAVDFLMNEWFGEFGFFSEASKANAVAAMLTPFVRSRISEGTPLVSIFANEEGWGKSLLNKMILLPGCGRRMGSTPVGGGEDEMRKQITASLRSLPVAVTFENVKGHIDSESLAGVLTTGVWNARILGTSRECDIEPRNMWMINGNNYSMSRELVERAMPIQLGEGEYWERLCAAKGWTADIKPRRRKSSEFSHPELLKWARANRGKAVEALFVLIRHSLDGNNGITNAGTFYRPRFYEDLTDAERFGVKPRKDSGEFKEWQGVVGRILEDAEIPGFMENYSEWAASSNNEGNEIAEFLGVWHSVKGSEPIKFADVKDMCGMGGELHEHLPAVLMETHRDRLNGQLLKWLKEHKKQHHGDFQLYGQKLGGTGDPTGWGVRSRKA